MKLGFLTTILLTVSLTIASGQNKVRLLDSVLLVLSDKEMFHGQVLVSGNGSIEFAKAYGKTVENELFTLDTPIDIQSVAKLFTGLAVMILKDEGKLSFNDPIKKFFPALPYDGVTVRNLLNHSSGIPNLFAVAFEHWPHDKLITNDDLVMLATRYKPKPVFKPGEREEYNETAYSILASIVEIAAHQKFETFIREKILRPCGMKLTHHKVEEPNALKKIEPITIDNMLDLTLGAGGYLSTATELFRLDSVLSLGKLVAIPTLNEAYETSALSNGKRGRYGLGCSILDATAGHRRVQNIGQGPGTNAVFTRQVDSRGALIVLHSQSIVYAHPIYEVIEKIWKGEPFEMPLKRVIHKLSPQLLRQYVGDYGDNGFMHLTSEDGRLFIQPDGNPSRMEIVPSSDTTFYFIDQAMDWQIYRNAQQEVIGFGPRGQKRDMMKRNN